MIRDEERTREARRRHKLGVIRLCAALAEGPRGSIFWQFRQRGGGTQAVRMRPGVPPVRDAEHREKHKRRKAAKAARRRNRR